MQQFSIILEETKLQYAAEQLINFAKEIKIFAFHAPMGAGKTTFIKTLCSVLGVSENMSSPTYSIVNEYYTQMGNKLFHFDLYRLKNTEECFDIGFEEYIDSGNYCFIEWPEVAEPLIHTKYVMIVIDVINNIRYLEASIK